MTPTRKSTLVVVAAAVSVAVAGGAFAFWTTTGAGSGDVSVTTTTAVTLSPATPTASLYPGGQTDVALIVTNPNTARVRISSLTLNTSKGTAGFDVDAGHSGCNVASLGFTTQDNGGTGWTVPGKVGPIDGSLSITLSNAVSMVTSAANACQGATFTVYLAAS